MPPIMQVFNYRYIVILMLLFLVLFSTTAVHAEEDAKLDPSAAGRIININGNVEVMTVDQSSWQKASDAQLLYPGDTVRTGRDGKASLIMSDETMIQLNRNTQFQLKEVERNAGWFNLDELASSARSAVGSLYEIVDGKVWARNKNKKVSARFKTPTMTAGIRGTELTIEVKGDGKTRTVVVEGSVEHVNDFGRVVAVALTLSHRRSSATCRTFQSSRLP